MGTLIARPTLIVPSNGRSRCKSRALRWLVWEVVLAMVCGQTVLADPQVCLGFNPETGLWGSQIRGTELLCPEQYALMGTSKPMDDPKSGSIDVAGACCPLPELDVLLPEHQFVESSCGENAVATGLRRVDVTGGVRVLQLRCTTINLERYQLGDKTEGALWGFDLSSGPYFWKEQRVLQRTDLPPALRTGLARHDFQEFSPNGCVGQPFGSLLVAKTGKRCKHLLFRELQYRSKEPDESPVRMFPNCRYITDPFSVTAKCVE